MHDQHRDIARHLVQFIPGRVAELLQLRIVIAEAENEVDLLHDVRVLRGPVTERRLDGGDQSLGPSGGGSMLADTACMPPPITCPWESTKPGSRARPPRSTMRVAAPLCFITSSAVPTARMRPALDGHGFRPGIGVVDGDDGTPGIDDLRLLRRAGCGGGEKGGGCDAGKEGSAGDGEDHDGLSQLLELDLCTQ